MFSVVIPVYNHVRYVREAIESVVSNQFVAEVLVVDDGSTDGSWELLETLAQQFGPLVKLLGGAERANLGADVRLNQLCRASSGPWIAVLNSDDQFCVSRLEVARDIARLSNCDFISGTLLIMDEESSIIGTKRGHFEPEYALPNELLEVDIRNNVDLLRVLCSQNVIATTSNMIFSKELYTRLGGFRDLRYCHDWDFALRACIHGVTAFSPHPLTKYRTHASNTIKEQSAHADGEVVKIFTWLLEDYPWIEDDPKIVSALGSNLHLGRFVQSREIGRLDSDAETLSDVRLIGFGAVADEADDAGRTILLPPKTGGFPARALANMALCFAQRDYDFVLLSETLQELPIVHLESFECNIINRGQKFASTPTDPRHTRRGRLMRHVPATNRTYLSEVDLRFAPAFKDMRWDQSSNIFSGPVTPRHFSRIKARPLQLPTLPPLTGRPRCLIFPTFMAMGGVERNTIEIIRALKHKYDFLVVTSEHLFSHQGTLHHQLDELEVPCLDLAEVANVDRHIVMLEAIRQSFQPNVVYICNGSQWLVNSAFQFRRVFGKTAIVDQQVYDADAGWVEHYNSKGIQSFDRFVATNERILHKFVSEFRIPRNRVDLIYPCINSNRLRAAFAEIPSAPEKPEVYARKIHKGGRVFAFIGRLTAQKRPLDFLDLARRSLHIESPDQFMLVGDGELAAACDEYIALHNLANTTRLQSYDDVCEVVSLIDGLVIVSAFEGLPIVLLETLALGKPALSTDVGDIALLLHKYKSGLIINECGNTEVTWCLFTQFRDRLSEFSENALRSREEILTRFSAETTARSYDESWKMAIRQVPK